MTASWLTFVEAGRSTSGKTRLWAVVTKDGKEKLGVSGVVAGVAQIRVLPAAEHAL
jgi:hypothetical protein